MKLPFMQFYPDQWLTEPGLRACSLAARGLWADLVCFMWKATPERGVLRTGNQVWGLEQVANAESVDIKIAQELLNELLKNHVTERRKKDGALICRRMVREEKRRKQTRKRVRVYRSCNTDVTRDISEVRSHISEVRSRSSSDDPLTLLPELQAKYPSYQLTAEDVTWACEIIATRANAPPGSLAYWRKALIAFMENGDAEIAAWRKRTEAEREAHAGHNPYGRAN